MEETKSPKRRRTSLAILIQQDLEDAWKKEQRDGASEKSIAMLTLNSARGALERTLCPGLGLSPKDEDWHQVRCYGCGTIFDGKFFSHYLMPDSRYLRLCREYCNGCMNRRDVPVEAQNLLRCMGFDQLRCMTCWQRYDPLALRQFTSGKKLVVQCCCDNCIINDRWAKHTLGKAAQP